MVIQVKRAKETHEQTTKNLKTASAPTIGIKRSRPTGRTRGNFQKRRQVQDRLVSAIKTKESKVSQQEFDQLINSLPSKDLPYDDRVQAINAWIDKNRAKLENPKYSAIYTRIQKKLQDQNIKEYDTAIYNLKLSDNYVERSGQLNEFIDSNQSVLSRGKNYERGKNWIDQQYKELQNINEDEYNSLMDQFNSSVVKKVDKAKKVTTFSDIPESKPILGEIDVSKNDYDGYLTKLNTFLEDHQDVLARGKNFDRSSEFITKQKTILDNINKYEYDTALQGLQSKWSDGEYHENADLLNTFITDNQKLLGRSKNYDNSMEWIGSQQKLLDSDFKYYKANATSLKGADGNFLTIRDLIKDPDYIKTYYEDGSVKSIKSAPKSYLSKSYKKRRKGRDNRYDKRTSSYTPYELTFDIDGDRIKESIRKDFEYEYDYNDLDDGYARDKLRKVGDFSTITYDKNGKILKKVERRDIRVLERDDEDGDSKEEHELKDMLVENYRDGVILNKTIYDDYKEKDKSYSDGDRKEFYEMYTDKFYDYENSLMFDYNRPDTNYSYVNNAPKTPTLNVGNTFISRDQTKDYKNQPVTVVDGKIMLASDAAKLIKDFNSKNPSSGSSSHGSKNSELNKMSVIGIDEYNMAKYNMTTAEMKNLLDTNKDMYLKVKNDVNDRLNYGSVNSQREATKISNLDSSMSGDSYLPNLTKLTPAETQKVQEQEFRQVFEQDILQRQDSSSKLSELNILDPSLSNYQKASDIIGNYKLSNVALTHLNKQSSLSDKQKEDIDTRYEIGHQEKALDTINKNLIKKMKETGLDVYSSASAAFAENNTQSNYVALRKAEEKIQKIDQKTMDEIQTQSVMMDILGGKLNKNATKFKVQQDLRDKQSGDLFRAETNARDLAKTIVDNKLTGAEAEMLRTRTRLDLIDARRDYADNVDIYNEQFADRDSDYENLSFTDRTVADFSKGGEILGNFFTRKGFRQDTISERRDNFKEVKEGGILGGGSVLGAGTGIALSKDSGLAVSKGYWREGHKIKAVGSVVPALLGTAFVKTVGGLGSGIDYLGEKHQQVAGVTKKINNKIIDKLQLRESDKQFLRNTSGLYTGSMELQGKVMEGVGEYFKYKPLQSGTDVAFGIATAGAGAIIGSAAKTASLGRKVVLGAKAAKALSRVKGAGRVVGIGMNTVGTTVYAGSTGLNMLMADPEDRAKVFGEGLAAFGTFEAGQFMGGKLLKLGSKMKVYDPDGTLKYKYIKKKVSKPKSQAIMDEFKTLNINEDPLTGKLGRRQAVKRITDTSFDELVELSKYDAPDIAPKLRKTTEIRLTPKYQSDIPTMSGDNVQIPSKREYNIEHPVDAYIGGEPVTITRYHQKVQKGKSPVYDMEFTNKVTGKTSKLHIDNDILRGYQVGPMGTATSTKGKIRTVDRAHDFKNVDKLEFIRDVKPSKGSVVSSDYGISYENIGDTYTASNPKRFRESSINKNRMQDLQYSSNYDMVLQAPKSHQIIGDTPTISKSTVTEPLMLRGKTSSGKKFDIDISKGHKDFDGINVKGRPVEHKAITQHVRSNFDDYNLKAGKKVRTNVIDDVSIRTDIDTGSPYYTKQEVSRPMDSLSFSQTPKKAPQFDIDDFNDGKYMFGQTREKTFKAVQYGDTPGVSQQSYVLEQNRLMTSNDNQQFFRKQQTRIPNQPHPVFSKGSKATVLTPIDPLSKNAPVRLTGFEDMAPSYTLNIETHQSPKQKKTTKVDIKSQMNVGIFENYAPPRPKKPAPIKIPKRTFWGTTKKMLLNKGAKAKPLLFTDMSNSRLSSLFGGVGDTVHQQSTVRALKPKPAKVSPSRSMLSSQPQQFTEGMLQLSRGTKIPKHQYTSPRMIMGGIVRTQSPRTVIKTRNQDPVMKYEPSLFNNLKIKTKTAPPKNIYEDNILETDIFTRTAIKSRPQNRYNSSPQESIINQRIITPPILKTIQKQQTQQVQQMQQIQQTQQQYHRPSDYSPYNFGIPSPKLPKPTRPIIPEPPIIPIIKIPRKPKKNPKKIIRKRKKFGKDYKSKTYGVLELLKVKKSSLNYL